MDAGLMGLKADGWGLQLLKGTMDVSYKRSPTENMRHDSALFRGGNATRFRHFMAPNACGVHAH